jgi:protein-S-isoprenylcysteine O-methyltransferase Ste14
MPIRPALIGSKEMPVVLFIHYLYMQKNTGIGRVNEKASDWLYNWSHFAVPWELAQHIAVSRSTASSGFPRCTPVVERPQRSLELRLYLQPKMANLPECLFAVAVVLSSFITMLCSLPPKAAPQKAWSKDRLGLYATPAAATLRRIAAVCIGLYHAAMAVLVVPDNRGYLCQHPENLNRGLFGWNIYTALCLFLIICVGGPLRLASFSGLGQNFTFRLGPPSKLVTSGVYRHMQHPSYTGQILVLTTNLILYLRWDGVLGCWASDSCLARLRGWGLPVFAIIIFSIARKLMQRIMDEEEMLRHTFGPEWEKWHKSTPRFIPGII